MAAYILYVEDDASLAFVTRDNLELQGYSVHHCLDGKSALSVAQREKFDLCILDVMLPEMDGFTLAQEIRKFDTEIPIIFLTAKSLKEDKIKGLKLGGDDYITKPFSIEELILKIEIFLRRRNVSAPLPVAKYRFGNFEFDYPNLELISNGFKETLTQREADLLKYLLERPNQVIKRSDILETLWGEDDYFLGRSLDVFISRLRKYLKLDEDVKIENVHGVGFRFKM
jgi:DNA-binding response OmpR family regulator